MASVWPRATIEIGVIAILLFAVQRSGAVVGVGVEHFALGMAVTQQPWTLVTSVYAHGGLAHLVTNLAALLLFGTIIEAGTTRWRFHAFVLGTGVLAGIVQVLVSAVLGRPSLVLGISGAVFGLMGYLLVANPVTDRVLAVAKLNRNTRIVLLLVVAGGVTIATAGEGVGLIAHFTGFVVGLVAGRTRLLRVGPDKHKPEIRNGR